MDFFFVMRIFSLHLYGNILITSMKFTMPRPRTLRKVVAPPKFTGFKPYGEGEKSKEFIALFYEEYEAIKLADYKLMNHSEAAFLMGVSRSTFARIYEKARRKVAQALVEAKEIRAVYGNAVLDKNWYVCKKCHARFTIPKTIKKHSCAMCASDQIEFINK